VGGVRFSPTTPEAATAADRSDDRVFQVAFVHAGHAFKHKGFVQELAEGSARLGRIWAAAVAHVWSCAAALLRRAAASARAASRRLGRRHALPNCSDPASGCVARVAGTTARASAKGRELGPGDIGNNENENNYDLYCHAPD